MTYDHDQHHAASGSSRPPLSTTAQIGGAAVALCVLAVVLGMNVHRPAASLSQQEIALSQASEEAAEEAGWQSGHIVTGAAAQVLKNNTISSFPEAKAFNQALEDSDGVLAFTLWDWTTSVGDSVSITSDGTTAIVPITESHQTIAVPYPKVTREVVVTAVTAAEDTGVTLAVPLATGKVCFSILKPGQTKVYVPIF